MDDHYIIVGAGHGGAQLCASLRQNGYLGRISMISNEDCLPYHRPPLSKAFLKHPDTDKQIIKPQAFYEDNNIELLLGHEVTAIERCSGRVALKDGSKLAYSKLILATGARARLLAIPGANAGGVHYLKIADDAVLVRKELVEAKNISVIGGGFIGLEAAATFAGLGKKVSVFEAGPRLLGRAVSPEISEYFLTKHRAEGMEIYLNANVEEILQSDGWVNGVRCDGNEIDADMILIGIGVVANCEIAKIAGLQCENGIEVDSHMQTSDPNILAIGDCVSFEHWQTGARVRLESIQNANDQARNAALTLTGNLQSYSEVPWFWSDQGDDKLQIVGLSNNSERRIVKQQPELNRISIFHFDRTSLVAIDTVNNQAEHMIGRRILAGGNLPDFSDVSAGDFDFRAFFKSIS